VTRSVQPEEVRKPQIGTELTSILPQKVPIAIIYMLIVGCWLDTVKP